MALGSTQIYLIDANIDIIRNEITKDISDRLNTFNYVYNELDKWSDETVVGTTLRNQIKKMNSGIEELTATTSKLIDRLSEYVSRQKEINDREEL